MALPEIAQPSCPLEVQPFPRDFMFEPVLPCSLLRSWRGEERKQGKNYLASHRLKSPVQCFGGRHGNSVAICVPTNVARQWFTFC